MLDRRRFHRTRPAAATLAAYSIFGIFLAFAASLWCAPAWARDEVFAVAGVAVDVTAENAAKAREKALADGAKAAFRRLLERLTLLSDRSRLPNLPSGEIDALVQDLSVANEKTSAVRYLADLTFRFKPDAVRKRLDDLALPYAETPSKPVLVLPVYRSAGALLLWDDPNPWRQAWSKVDAKGGLVPMLMPIGDLTDVAAIGAEQAAAGDQQRLSAIAKRYNAGDTMVVLATLSLDAATTLPAMQISVSRYGSGAGTGEAEFNFIAASGEGVDGLLTRAAAQVATFVEDAWKHENLIQMRKPGALVARVPIAALSEWLTVRDRLGGVAVVRRIDLMLLSKREARVNLHFIGDADQLVLALKQADLNLARVGEEWELTLPGSKPRG